MVMPSLKWMQTNVFQRNCASDVADVLQWPPALFGAAQCRTATRVA
jgi:hypothetical protein